MKRPQNLVYALDEAPPPLVTLLNGVQHVGLIAINLVYPLLIFRVAGTPTSMVADLVAMGMIVLGLATFLQAHRTGPVGSGYLCPATFTATYLSPSLVAVKAGGLPLLFGMTIFAGLLEAVLARALNRLRAVEPGGFAYVTNNYLPNLLSRTLSFRRIGIFAGKIDMTTINQDEAWTLTFRYDGSRDVATLGGDHRDWNAIRAWAEQVADDLA